MSVFKCIELENKEYSNKDQMLKALKENKDLIIAQKKIKKTTSDTIGGAFIKQNATKSFSFVEDGYIYPVINTTNYMDSHNDVHLKGIWKRSIKDKQGRIHYTTDHELKISNIIAYPKDVELMTIQTTFKELGYNMEGETEALIFKTKPQSYSSPQAIKIIADKIPIQHSVRMEYVKWFLAVKSDDPELEQENENYKKYINQIANKEQVEELGYFWGHTESKIISEGSMVVNGSNDITPMIYSDEPSIDTQKNQPSNDIDKKKEYLRSLLK
jgi:hypothetical protein